MARVITSITRLTELDAVHEMLAAIGEAPVLQAEIESPTLADVTIALNLLMNTHQEICSLPWHFNMDFGFELAPDDTYDWIGTAGATATLNVWEVPSNLAAFNLTANSEQSGVDMEAVPPRDYTAAEGTLVFYDREKNRDGLDSDDFDYLYIDAIWFRDFEDCPEVVRRYVTIKAARRFQARVLGSQQLDAMLAQDEIVALRNLKREQGLPESLNLFNNSDTQRHLCGQ